MALLSIAKIQIETILDRLKQKVKDHDNGVPLLIEEALKDYTNDIKVLEQFLKQPTTDSLESEIKLMCEIILGNNFGNKELDSLALYVEHYPDILNAKQPTDSQKPCVECRHYVEARACRVCSRYKISLSDRFEPKEQAE